MQNHRNSDHDFGLLIGALFGIAATLLVLATIMLVGVAGEGLEAFLYKWQTLITGFFALVAAIVSGRILLGQTQEQRRQFEELRLGRLRAARTIFQTSIGYFTQYAMASAEVAATGLEAVRLEAVGRMADGKKSRLETLELPELPDHVLSDLRMLSEHAAENEAKHLGELTRCYLSQRHSLWDLIEAHNKPKRFGRVRLLTERNWEQSAGEAVELLLVAWHLFPYVHGKIESIPETQWTTADVSNAINVLNLTDVLSSDYQKELIGSLAKDAVEGGDR